MEILAKTIFVHTFAYYSRRLIYIHNSKISAFQNMIKDLFWERMHIFNVMSEMRINTEVFNQICLSVENAVKSTLFLLF